MPCPAHGARPGRSSRREGETRSQTLAASLAFLRAWRHEPGVGGRGRGGWEGAAWVCAGPERGQRGAREGRQLRARRDVSGRLRPRVLPRAQGARRALSQSRRRERQTACAGRGGRSGELQAGREASRAKLRGQGRGKRRSTDRRHGPRRRHAMSRDEVVKTQARCRVFQTQNCQKVTNLGRDCVGRDFLALPATPETTSRA